MKKIISVFFLLTFFGCKSQEDKWHSVSKICDCYSKIDGKNIDLKLNNCLEDFNRGLTSENVDFKNSKMDMSTYARLKIEKLSKELIQKCPKYQEDFNSILINKFSNTYPLISKKDSISNLVKRKINNSNNLRELSGIAVAENELETALELINESIKLDPKFDFSYWIKVLVLQKQNKFKEAASICEQCKKMTKDLNSKFYCDLMIENLKIEERK